MEVPRSGMRVERGAGPARSPLFGFGRVKRAAGAAAAALLAILLLVGRKQLAAEARKLFSLR